MAGRTFAALDGAGSTWEGREQHFASAVAAAAAAAAPFTQYCRTVPYLCTADDQTALG